MNHNKTAFQLKIHPYSKSTKELLMRMVNSENVMKIHDIVMESETEAEAIEKIKALQK